MTDTVDPQKLYFFASEDGPDDLAMDAASFAQEDGQALQVSRVAPAGPANTVILPSDAVIDEVFSEGRDLVIVLADGSRIVIPDGAIVLPQLVVGDTAVPAANLAALLVGNEPEPAAGAPQSSGGNFAGDPGEIQSAFDIGDLLPYTELSRALAADDEIIPFAPDDEPEIGIEVGDSGVSLPNAEDAVDEAGLPERNGEPEGTDSAADSESTSGFINFVSPDGTETVTINGVAITAVGQTFDTSLGQLTITSIADGRIGYDYVLTDNTIDPATSDFFTVSITDTDGDVATATLTINIIDDAPIGVDDSDSVPAGSHAPISGDVVANDIPGADGLPAGSAVTGFGSGGATASPGESLQGEYGVLTLNADGTYTYVRDVNTPGGVEESFDYQIVDQDGSTSGATLTILIGNSPNEITFVPDVGDGTVVDEGGLPPRGDEPAGTGEIADDDADNGSDQSETTSGTITFNSPDGVSTVTINGTPIDSGSLPQTIVQDDTGTLVIVDYTYDPVTGDGSITYEYTLGDNTSGDDTSVTFEIEVVDLDGDAASDTLTIDIVDDEPIANDDAPLSIAEDANAPATLSGNVVTNDTPGADGATVTSVNIGGTDFTVAASGTTVVDTANGSYTFTAAGAWTFDPNPNLDQSSGDVDASFTYTLTDGDGDFDTAIQPISITDGAGPQAGAPISLTVDDENLADGSDPDAPVTDSGSTTFTAGSDAIASIAFDDAASALDNLGGGLTWSRVSDTQITGSDGGTLVVTLDLSVAGNTATVTATLSNNYDSHPVFTADDLQALGSVNVVATDTDGDTATSAVSVSVSDDVPEARDDADGVTQGSSSTDGNVITGVGTDGGAGGVGADTPGADGASVSTTGTFNGTYGDLLLNANGSYTYTLNAVGEALIATLAGSETLTDSFDYTLTDGDDDTSEATLLITLTGTDDGVEITGLNADALVPEEVLDEDDLADGSSPTPGDLTQSGSFGVTSPDGLDDVQVNLVDVVVDGVFQGPVEVANDGVYAVEITGWTPVYAVAGDNTTPVVSATFSYTATLLDNTLAHDELGQDDIVNMLSVTADDTDGSSDSDVLDVQIVDDVPEARDDADGVTQGSSSTDGNVITGVGTDGGAGGVGADTPGADGASVSTTGTFNGTYGDLLLNANGSYTYTLNAVGEALIATLAGSETLTDSFDYTLTDGDDDTSEATLLITLTGTDDGVEITGLNADALVPEEVLDEDDLADGSSPTPGDLTQSGSFGVTSPDGLDDVQVNLVDVVVDGVFQGPVEVANDGVYAVEITGWTPVYAVAGDNTTPVVSATFSYTATLLDNTLAHDELGQDDIVNMLSVTADDTDGSSDSDVLDVQIVDDVPEARDDADGVTQGSSSTDGNVITGVGTDGGAGGVGADTPGADGASVSTTGTFNGTYGDLLLNANGSYTYTLNAVGEALIATLAGSETLTDSFDYTLTDGDDDTSEATLLITLTGTDDGVEITGLNADALVPEEVLDEDDLADGSSPTPGDLTQSGSFGVTSPDGLDDVQVNLVDVVVDGVFQGPVEVANDGVYAVEITGWTPVYAVAGDNTTPVVSATFSYTATLLDNTLAHDELGQDDIVNMLSVTADDTDGSSDSDVLDVQIVDDVPEARDDADGVTQGSSSTDGNVITGVGTDGGAGGVGADTPGADGASVSTTGTFNGTYGDLLLNANGSYTYTLNAVGEALIATLAGSETLTDSFDYTLTDGDDDTSEATLLITLTGTDDGVEITGLNADALVPEEVLDEDDLADGSSPTPGDLTQSGSFGVTSPDGLDDVQVNLVDVVVDGVFQGPVEVANDGVYAVEITGWTPVYAVAGDNTTPVVSATFSYTATLLDNTLAHDELGQDDIVNMLSVTADDTDGSSDSDVLDVQIVDDVPEARDDADGVTQGSSSTDGNVITGVGTDGGAGGVGADTPGADGASVSTTGTFNGTYGDLLLNANGSYTYTLNAVGEALIATLAGSETLTDSFDYTLTDGDDDTSEATLLITLTGTDDGVEITGLNADALVPEEVLDEDDLADGSSPTPGDLTQSGSFGVTSPDGLDDVQVNLVDVVVDGVFQGPVEVANDGVYAVEITGWTPVYAVAGDNTTPVVSATFSYTATLLDNTLAHDELGQDDIVNMLSVTADDTDGSSDSDVLDVQIVDDVPEARDDADGVTQGSSSTDGNVITGVGTDGGAGGVGADTPGADGASVSTTGTFNGTYGDLLLNANGSYTYTLNAVGEALIATLAGSETLTDSFDYTLTDGDDDTSEATLLITLTGTDDGVEITGLNADALVPEEVLDEDDLADGSSPTPGDLTQSGSFGVTSPDGLDDVQVNLVDVVVDGVFQGPVEVANDGVYAVEITGWTPVYAVAGDNTTPVVSATFSYTATLLDNTLAHDELGQDDIVNMLSVTADDTDGSSDSDVLDVQIVDDVPADFTPVALTDTTGSTATLQDDALENSGSATATRLIHDPDNDETGTNFMGADGFGSLAFANGSDGDILQSNGNDITSGGDLVYLFGFGTDTLIATTDNTNTDPGAVVFEMSLDPGTGHGDDATYSIEFFATLDDGSGFTFDDFSSAPAGQNEWIGLDADGGNIDASQNDSQDVLITGLNGGSVNTSSTDIGSNNQWIDENEGIRIDYVTDVSGSGSEGTAQGYNFDGHYTVTDSSFTILQVKGNGTNATVTVELKLDPDTGNIKDLTGSTVAVDVSSIVVTDNGGNDITGSVSITDNGDGTVTIGGLSLNDNVFLEGASDFNAIEIAHGGGDDFALGEFGFRSSVAGNDVPLSFDIEATDGDGDTSTGTIDMILSPPTTPPIALDLDGDGVEFIGLDGGMMFDYGGGQVATAWVAADDGVLARDLGGRYDVVFTDDAEGALTDLEGLSMAFDSNGDGLFSSEDASWGEFGVLQDGAFTGLDAMGITQINLSTDGAGYRAAEGDVLVHGTGEFTWSNGSTGLLADAGFATAPASQRQMETALSLAATAGFIAGAALEGSNAAWAMPANQVDQAGFSTDPISDTQSLVLPANAAQFEIGDGVEASRSTTDEPVLQKAFLSSEDVDIGDTGIADFAAAGAEEPILQPASTPTVAESVFATADFAAIDAALMDALLVIGERQSPGDDQSKKTILVEEVIKDSLAESGIDEVVETYAENSGADQAADTGPASEASLAAFLNFDVADGAAHLVQMPVQDAMNDSLMSAGAQG